MSRRKTAKKRPVAPDAVYQSRLVSLLVSHLLKAVVRVVDHKILETAQNLGLLALTFVI